MVLNTIPMAFFSKVAFPAIYQGLFTYFLLLGMGGSMLLQAYRSTQPIWDSRD